MNPSINLQVRPSPQDMPNGHVSSVALYRAASDAVIDLARVAFPGDWGSKLLFISDISLRFIRAVESSDETLRVSAQCPEPPSVEHSMAGFSGEIRFGADLLAARFHGKLAIR